MAGPYGKLKADHLVWWDPTIDPNTGVAIGDVEKTLEDISDKATVANPEFTGNVKLTAQGELRLADSDSDKHVGFKSPAVVNNDVIWSPSSYITKNGILNSLQAMLRNTNYEAKKTEEYNSKSI